MKCKTSKPNLTQLKVIPLGRFTQRRRGLATGFTLVEILVAVVIIVSIVSMVYGSYFTTAKSTEVYKAKMILSAQARKVLMQMARQIRCSYPGKAKEHTDSAGKAPQGEIKINEKPIIYFNCEPDTHGGQTLHLVTTHRLFCQETQKDGLFDIIYKFDKNSGMLFLNQRQFIGTSEELIEERNFRPLLANIERFELDFFDSHQWLSKWDFKQKKELPYAVKISITCKDENQRHCHYSIVANVGCSANQDRSTTSKKFMSINK